MPADLGKHHGFRERLVDGVQKGVDGQLHRGTRAGLVQTDRAATQNIEDRREARRPFRIASRKDEELRVGSGLRRTRHRRIDDYAARRRGGGEVADVVRTHRAHLDEGFGTRPGKEAVRPKVHGP